MSTELNKAIYARLAGTEVLTGAALAAQTALAALLAVDPNLNAPAVHKDSLQRLAGIKPDSVRYPCITFRMEGGAIDDRFADGVVMGNPIYDMEFWSAARSGTIIGDINEQVERLLDRRRQIAPAFTLASGHCYWMEMMTELYEMYNDRINVWGGLRRLRIVEARY